MEGNSWRGQPGGGDKKAVSQEESFLLETIKGRVEIPFLQEKSEHHLLKLLK
jgi:hypothetical protein